MHQGKFLSSKMEEAEQQWDLLSAKLSALERQKIMETRADERFRLDQEILQAKEQREGIEQNLRQLAAEAEHSASAADISPGFDVAAYRSSLQCCYGYLKLYTLDSTDRTDSIRLWNMFIEQQVREALPPLFYELPVDVKRQLQEQGLSKSDLELDDLEGYRREYFERPLQDVLEVTAKAQRAVILGDPGSGKSTLLQYLTLDWVEGKTELLPLLIELREYANTRSANFLEFLQCGHGVNWQFDQRQLQQYLLEHPTLVLFDGLDEVFDRGAQRAVVEDIVRFAQQYPGARVLVTSRIIGYNPERFRHAGFNHFTLQPLNDDKIQEFIERWYTLALGDDPDKPRLVQRLKSAIADSKSIRNLAENPLLLTMMAILNRRQELPRDRGELYDQASRVLLYHWDVDHKRLQLPADAIGRREKQEMLRLIAYEMQAGEGGLQGNLISEERLVQLLTDYLRDQGFAEPREKANILLQQLRERNFILCYRGADNYGFLHRTFLEYFCAAEIVQRFERQRTLSFEELRDKIFGEHWQDDSWHEVLRLICGMIAPCFVGELIEWLMELEVDKHQFLQVKLTHLPTGADLKRLLFYYQDDYLLEKEGLLNLILAARCFAEVKHRTKLKVLDQKLLATLQQEVDEPYAQLHDEAAREITATIASGRYGQRDVLHWLQTCINRTSSSYLIPYAAISAISKNWNGDTEVLSWLKNCAYDESICNGYAIYTIGHEWKDAPNILSWLKEKALDKALVGRGMAVQELSLCWKEDKEVYPFLKQLVKENDFETRAMSVRELARDWHDDPELLPLCKEYAQNDPYVFVRQEAIIALAENWKDDPEVMPLLKNCASTDIHPQACISATHFLSIKFRDNEETLPWLKKCAQSDNWAARTGSIYALGEHWQEDEEALGIITNALKNDNHWQVRKRAVTALAKGWKNEEDTFSLLCHTAQHDVNSAVRYQAVFELAQNYKEKDELFDLLYVIAADDSFVREKEEDYNPRLLALKVIFRFRLNSPATLKLLQDRIENDPDEQLRNWAEKKLPLITNHKTEDMSQ